MTRTYVEEIRDPVTGQLQVFEAATEAELERLVAAAFPQEEASDFAPGGGQTGPGGAPGSSTADRHVDDYPPDR